MSTSSAALRSGGKPGALAREAERALKKGVGRNGRAEKSVPVAVRKAPPILERVYALRGYTVKVENGKYYVAPTIAFQNKLDWKGPYTSLQHATSAIARKLQEEFTRRDKAAAC